MRDSKHSLLVQTPACVTWVRHVWRRAATSPLSGLHADLNGLLGLILDTELLGFVIQDLLWDATGLFTGATQQGPQLLGQQTQHPASAYCTSATFTQAADIPTLSS